MSDRIALVKSIQSSPDDDLPRLVFADWLDEHGEGERAALVRWQCETGVSFLRRGDGWLRSLMKVKANTISPPRIVYRALNGFLSNPVPKPFTVARGFISRVNCSFALWLQHAESVLPESAGLTVELTTRPSSEWMARSLNKRIPTGGRFRPVWDDATTHCSLSSAWPGVTFTLPESSWIDPPLAGGPDRLAAFARDILASRPPEERS